MRLAYADPPYLGLCRIYQHRHEDPWGCWDDPAEHERLMIHLDREFDGWAYSLTSTTLQELLPLAPSGVRVGAWTKPFASFKPGVRCAYTWEPVIFRPGRDEWSRDALTVRDHLACPITLQRGLVGAKPERFAGWVLDLLGYQDGDEVADLFPGTGIMGAVLRQGTLV